ncbi:MAG: hypothetical protein ACYC96_11325 [Fimbriimonadaceae bacterium]
MTRNLIAVCTLFVCGAVVAGLALAQTKPASFISKHYSVTNIDPAHFKFQMQDGTVSVRGLPRLHAVLPEKHVTLDGAALIAKIDTKSGLLKTAQLSGGVTGTLDSTSADGPEHLTFAGSTVSYTNLGAATEQSADIEVSGGAQFGSVNSVVKRTLRLTGSHGVFQVRTTAGKTGLASADLDGPVTVDFSGVIVNKDKTKETPVSGNATGGHLTVRRAGAGYVIRLSGGVAMREITGPLEGAKLNTAVVNIELDANGNFVSFWSDDATTATVPTGKHRV